MSEPISRSADARCNLNFQRKDDHFMSEEQPMEYKKNVTAPDQPLSRLQSLGWQKDDDMYAAATVIQLVLLNELCGVEITRDNIMIHPFDVHAPVLLIGTTSVGTAVVPALSESVFVDELNQLVSDVVVFGWSDAGHHEILGWIETERFKAEGEVRDAVYFPVSKLKNIEELRQRGTGQPIVYMRSGERSGQYANLSEYRAYLLENIPVIAYSCETYTGHKDPWCRHWFLKGPDPYFVHVLRADGHIYL